MSFLGIQSAQAQYTANYQTNIISGVTNYWTGDYVVGSNTYADALLIQNSGILTNFASYLGYETGSSNNSALVTGPGSLWYNWFELHVGWYGAGNSVVVSNGGRVFSTTGLIGYNPSGSNNSVLVTGAGSVWTNVYILHIGDYGPGNSVLVNNTGQLFSSACAIGYRPGTSNNSVVIAGPGSMWSNSGELSIGRDGTGNSLVVSNGGQVVNVSGTSSMGSYSRNNSALVTGPGSLWRAGTNLYVGNSGSENSLVINNGGLVVSSNSYVGYGFPGSNNFASVTGPGSVWSNSYALRIGGLGMGNSLVISNGGRVVGDTGFVGDSFARYSSVLVTGLGSVWSNVHDVYVGRYGIRNSLVISNSGQVFNGDAYMGSYSTGTSNTVRVADGAVWRNNSLRVGDQGSANSLVVEGGSVFATNLTVGFASTTCDNSVELDAGSVVVTNATGDAVLEVRRGRFVLNDGVLQADRLVMTNACGLFVRNGGTLILGSLVLDPNLDADGDGLPNGWEQDYGLDPLNAADANADGDNDGMANWKEYLAGTNPTNKTSFLHITSLVLTGSDVQVGWTTVGGKSYTVQTNSTLGANFADFSPVITMPGTGEATTNFLDTAAATNWPLRFYRIRLVP